MVTNEHDNERLITRRLDDELTEEQSLALDRELLRDPELRQTFEQQQRIDLLARETLARELEAASGAVDIAAITLPQRTVRFPRPHRGWLLIPGAIAAAVMALVIPAPEFSRTPEAGEPQRMVAVPSTPERYTTPNLVDYRTRPVSAEQGLLHNVNTMKRSTGRDIIGVVGEDGNIYWIEVDRTRTITVPRRTNSVTNNQL